MKRSSDPPKKLDTLEDFHKSILTTVHHAVAHSTQLPRDEDHTLYMTYPAVKNFIKTRSARTIELINTILSKGPSKRKTINPPGVTNLTKGTTNDFLERLVEINDDYQQYSTANLENARSCHFGHVNKNASNILKVLQRNIASQAASTGALVLTKEKVQEHFEDVIDNTEALFVPKIWEKPNAAVPLPKVLVGLQDERYPDRMANIVLDREKDHSKKLKLAEEIYTHPYKQELIHEFNEITYVHENISRWTGFDKENISYNENYTFIESLDSLKKFISDQKQFSEIAVDTEYHSDRSYQGFICLIQVSNSKHDYLIDALKLRSHLYLLNEIFTDPKIEKIFHGGETDSRWLQQCGVYLVNTFDTQMAKMVLQGAEDKEGQLGGNKKGMIRIQRSGYKNLCDEYLDVQISKKYQRSDWRKRPLLENQLKYAREDTRRLIVLAAVMKTEMGASDLIKTYSFCKEINLVTYKKPEFNEHSYKKIIEKVGYRLNEAQEECVRLLAAWRDQYARQEDENPNWVLPKYLLLNIARELPKESSGVLACCTPVPQAVREQIYDITDLVDKARLIQMKIDSDKNAGKIKIVSRDTSSQAKVNVAKMAEEKGVFDYDDPMQCPHDRRRNTKFDNLKDFDVKFDEKKETSLGNFSTVSTAGTLDSSVTHHSFLANIGKSIQKLQNVGGSFEWKFNDIEYKPPEEAVKNDQLLKPAGTNNVEIDIGSKLMSKKLKKIKKREEFIDMAVNAGTTTLEKSNRNLKMEKEREKVGAEIESINIDHEKVRRDFETKIQQDQIKIDDDKRNGGGKMRNRWGNKQKRGGRRGGKGGHARSQNFK